MKGLYKILFISLLISFSNVLKARDNNSLRITATEEVFVEAPAGTVPRLPHMVWVTYSDGSAGYRQAVWNNSASAAEKELADTCVYPAGRVYGIEGFIIGDNTTANGFPLKAHIKVTSREYDTPDRETVCEPLPLCDVTINGDNRLTSNRNLAIRTILSWDVSQQLYNYRDAYGLSTEGYKQADGWDSPTTKLKGHGSGHYMSALAFAFASTTDKEQKDSLRSRMARMVNELRLCQERTFVWNDSLDRYWEARDFAPEQELRNMKGTWADFDNHKKEYARYGYGYLNAIPAHHAVLIEMYRPYNNSDWVWAPYYAIHKQLAGLIDIATYVDDKGIADKALLIAKDMGLWIWNRLHYRTFVKADGTREERRLRPGNRYEMWNMYIAGEDGGTGESLSRLSEMVKDKEEKARLLEAASFFDSPAFFDPLSRNIDDIRTRHANQHIPKITSALRSYRGNGKDYYYNLALNFWQLVQGRYAYASGGVGNGEMFRQPYTQILSMNTNVYTDRNGQPCPNPTLNETCCAYNLAKLTKDLNCFTPDDAALMDYYERVLYNQIVGSLHPEHYLTTYHYAVGLNASKPWGNRTPQESCCGGTGSESHVKYQEAVYFAGNKTLWVALYMPTTAVWREQNVILKQECRWPAEYSRIEITEGKGRFTMKLRVPYWATNGFEVKLNGKVVEANVRPSSYLEIPMRKWRKGDVVEVTMPFSKHIHYGPDKMETAATAPGKSNTPFAPAWVGTLMYGPLAMTTDGVTHWDEATLNIDSRLLTVTANAPTPEDGTNGNLYTLTACGRTFVPDYYADKNFTHYLRISLTDGNGVATASNDSSALKELMLIAEERIKAQEAWLKMEKKVPDHAPWAPYGYARMVEAYGELRTSPTPPKEGLMTSEPQNLKTSKPQNLKTSKPQNLRTSKPQNLKTSKPQNLKTAINTMRPGNLAELEELQPLYDILEKARKEQASTQNKEKAARLKAAIDYAEMVVKYVSDGSGTSDMIRNAINELRSVGDRR